MELSRLQAEQLGGGDEKTPKSKKWGVIPVKRRSVKRMMFDKIVRSVSSIFQACFHHASSGASSTLQPDNCGLVTEEMLKMAPYRETKKTRIFPRKDYLCAVSACQNDPSAN
ncbi:hypothetical protein DITRI_Ditri05aG0114100 [Diplodiscus trichospermus]